MKIGKRLRQVMSLFLTAILLTQLPVAAKAAPDRDGLTAAGPAAEEEMAGETEILTELPAERELCAGQHNAAEHRLHLRQQRQHCFYVG